MKNKVTLTGIRSWMYGVPKSIYAAYKKDGKFFIAVSTEICHHWYGMQSLRQHYNTTYIGQDAIFRQVYEVTEK